MLVVGVVGGLLVLGFNVGVGSLVGVDVYIFKKVEFTMWGALLQLAEQIIWYGDRCKYPCLYIT